MLRQRDSTLVPNSAPPPQPFCPPPPLHGLTLEPGIQLGSLPDPCSAPHVGNTMCCHSAPRPAPAPGLSLGPLARPAHHVPSLRPPQVPPSRTCRRSAPWPAPPTTCPHLVPRPRPGPAQPRPRTRVITRSAPPAAHLCCHSAGSRPSNRRRSRRPAGHSAGPPPPTHGRRASPRPRAAGPGKAPAPLEVPAPALKRASRRLGPVALGTLGGP